VSVRRAAPLLEERLCVLVVEDDLDALEAMAEVLEHSGYAVERARDGVEGWMLARSRELDAAVLDLRMPRLDGFELARRLRADPSTCRLPMVAVTGDPMEDDSIAARAPFTRVLRKPINGGALLDTVAGMIEPISGT
jgi:CheY-like chemotaxis protein